MLLAKIVKYKILEFCIDNFFEILSNNLNIYDKAKPYNVKVFIGNIEDDLWMMAINVHISGQDFEYFENKVSFEACQDALLGLGEQKGIDAITELLLHDFVINNSGKIDPKMLIKIIANVRRCLYQIIIKY